MKNEQGEVVEERAVERVPERACVTWEKFLLTLIAYGGLMMGGVTYIVQDNRDHMVKVMEANQTLVITMLSEHSKSKHEDASSQEAHDTLAKRFDGHVERFNRWIDKLSGGGSGG